VLVHDPLADEVEAEKYFGISLQGMESLGGVDAVILAVSHRYYFKLGLPSILRLCTNGKPIIMDLKGMYGIGEEEKDGITYWRL